MTGHVHLVGAGPGAVDLLTLRAARLIEQADIILYDALVSDDILALGPQAKKVPVGKRGGRVSMDQALINRLLVASARRHRVVVRLKGGDPMLFGRAHEEIEACVQAGIPVSIVPGISAAFGAAASLSTSLTRRGLSRSVTFVTPTVARGATTSLAWAKAVAAADTSVIYMGRTDAGVIRDTLLDLGMAADLPVVLAEAVSRSEAFSIKGVLGDLPSLAGQVGEGPVLMMIGDVFAATETEVDLVPAMIKLQTAQTA
ncbi:siroheme synthase [Candidatus Phycosocius bacilliformis]|uniref:uroporphyrinogen-III C-methyltransferase n=1 Tax=Candidatus Phycosocius bacilliformis TaxID=1445552 RepID=A0A2P2ED15_9PROT|nr:uroporphyrinogen-III C-methyltransferase [Candidatus Phycosocius bacilliformis]GBF58946.1 siroheme synthase [Candidatus Phycosocius bacilliformis]